MTLFRDLSGNNSFGVRLNEVRRASSDIAPSDTVAIPFGNKTYVGGAGNIVGRLPGGSADQTFAVVAGATLPFGFEFIRATGTTATGLKAVTDI